MLEEKKLIDDLLSGKVTLLTDQVNETTIGKKDEERKALLEEKNEKNQYGSSYDFSYDCNNVFECAGLQDNNSFSVVTNYEENMEENEEIDEENIESIFMVWSLEEIKYYYELMLQQSIEQDIDDYIQNWQQPTYEKLK